MYKFEKLIVWQKALSLLKSVYLLCNKLPTDEKNNIVNQIKRATLSISLNIAEGSGSENDKEYKRFLFIAKKSLFEVIATLKVINYLYKINVDEQIQMTDEVGKLLNGFINKLKTDS
ncbi:four helix bundle protein [Candidatus Roizmanbacteria bacterium]|nr:four helix bundle protein [Candidatus Roizmanbacteria bacterium]